MAGVPPFADVGGHCFKNVGSIFQAMVDQVISELIRSHQIDVLIDLAGHTKGSCMSVFGYQPASVQICWLGYPYTTGHRTCDYLLADKIVCPPEQAHL